MITVQLGQIRDSDSTDQQKVKYLLSDLSYYVYINHILWIIYYLLVLFAIYCLFYGKQRGFTTFVKIMILLLFFVYPLIITSLEIVIYDALYYVYALFFGMAYVKTNNVPTFSLFAALSSKPGYP